MYIGEFVWLAGTTQRRVRLCEQLGLLPEPGGAASIASTGPRIWSGSALSGEAQRLGCKLELVPCSRASPASTTSLAEGGAAYRGQAGADRGGGRPAATPASGAPRCWRSASLWRPGAAIPDPNLTQGG